MDNFNPAEYIELIRLREENKILKDKIKDLENNMNDEEATKDMWYKEINKREAMQILIDKGLSYHEAKDIVEAWGIIKDDDVAILDGDGKLFQKKVIEDEDEEGNTVTTELHTHISTKEPY